MQEFEKPDIESSTDDYATRFSGEIGEWFLDVQMLATLNPIKDLKNASVLDVGGGHGQLVGGLIENHYKLTVTGSSDSCKHRLEDFIKTRKIEFLKCPLVKIPEKDQRYDVVVSYRMMSHLSAWRDFVTEICRVSDKRVLVDYPTYRSFNILNKLLYRYKKDLEKNTREFTIFNERDIVEEFKKNGFQLKSRTGQFFMPMAFHRAHKNCKLGKIIEGVFRIIGLSYLFGSPVIACFERVES